MTLIISYINRYGIIHASDSNLTGGDDKNAGTGKKTFPVNYLSAGITVAGNYSVGGTPMDDWMNDFIQRQQDIQDITLETFCKTLKDELQNNMSKNEKQNGSLMHISGYVEVNNISHPEFWFVRNIHGMDFQTGEYKNIDETFEISEDFWTRDCPESNLMKIFKDKTVYSKQIYINGFTPGRIGYNIVSKKLDEFFWEIWGVEGWKFRQPKSLEDTERLVKLYMQVINNLFILSDYNAHYIGGDTQTLLIAQPPNIADSCL